MMTILVKRLSTGWWHVRGDGPCNYAQPKMWPCSEEELRASVHPEAGESFIRAALAQSRKVTPEPPV